MPEPTAELLRRIVDEVEKAIVGKRQVVELAAGEASRLGLMPRRVLRWQETLTA